MIASRFGLLSYPGRTNLGDTIQAIAARRFLPRIDLRIDRERLADAPPDEDGAIKLILNGWFMQDPTRWPPHPAIHPLPISMHFAETDFGRFQRFRARPIDSLLSGAGADFLRRCGPVGARDEFTAEQLTIRDIPNYLSGCLTLTLTRPDRLAREDFIVACDLSPAHLAHLQRATERQVIPVTHQGAVWRDTLACERAAEAMLDLYARASAVVTTRIHAALPCLGLGTPTLLIEEPGEGRRVSDAARLARSCRSNDFLRDRHDFDFTTPPNNSDTFRRLVPGLVEICQRFTGYNATPALANQPS